MNRIISAGLITSLAVFGSPSFAQPVVGCGANQKFQCISSPDLGASLCLRGPKNDPQFVRAVHNPDSWIIPTSPVPHTVDLLSPPSAGSPPCTTVTPNLQKVGLQVGDEIKISKDAKGKFWFDILSMTKQSYFQADGGPQPLSTPQPDSPWLLASTPKTWPNSEHWDYFVMLLDDGEGKPSSSGVGKIEKFYRVELFPSWENPANTMACAGERPDLLVPANPPLGIPAITNYHPWSGGPQAGCSGDTSRVHTLEVISSGSGEHPPG